jgi:hypothetical protein
MHCTVHPGKYCTLFPLWKTMRQFPISGERFGPLDQSRSEKVAWILRWRNCGVKEKDTIPSGMVAGSLSRG